VRVVRPGELGTQLTRPRGSNAMPTQQAVFTGTPPAPQAAATARPLAPKPAAGTVPAATRAAHATHPVLRQAAATPAAVVNPASRAPAPAATGRRLLTGSGIFSVIVCALLIAGWYSQTERYISPKRGFGYALGIIGGSLMLLLLLYSLRKRWSWLSFLGPTPSWFRAHMVLGVLGPLCILYHSNFTTGATNSNVALFCMLAVAGSGLIGRYIYVHIHHGLYGHKLQLTELRTRAESLHAGSGTISFLPELAARLDAAEQRLLRAGPGLSVLGFAKPIFVSLAGMLIRWRLGGYIRRALRQSARQNPVIAAQRKRLRATARAYVDRRLAATRRVAAFEGYERLFSLWHALHIPLIFIMIIAAVIHVIAVHVY
jgi:hypothetical protein